MKNFKLKTIKSHPEYETIKKYSNDNRCTIYEAALVLFGENNSCVYCGAKIFKITEPGSCRVRYANYCNLTCQNRDLHKNMTQEVRRSSVEKCVKTKSAIVNGKSIAHWGALKAAQNTNLHQKNEKISKTKRRIKEERCQSLSVRKDNMLLKKGPKWLFRYFLRIMPNSSYRRAMDKIKNHNPKIISLIGDEYYTRITYLEIAKDVLNFTKTCQVCGETYTSRNLLSPYYKLYRSDFVCSASCKNRLKILKLKERGYVYPKLSPERKLRISQDLVVRHANMSLESKKKIARKRYETMLHDIVDGKSALARRSEKAIATKKSRGVIVNVNNPEEITEYQEYRNRVSRYTNEGNIEALPNFDKRGKTSFHLDHIFPIAKGYQYRIPASLIGSIDNLVMLPAKLNQKKTDHISEIPNHIQEYINAENIKISI